MVHTTKKPIGSSDQQGFIPMIIFMLTVMIGIIVIAYLRVAHAGK